MTNNAKQNFQDACSQLKTCQDSLNQALNSVEKQENKQQIQNTLNAVNSALQTANTALSNYRE